MRRKDGKKYLPRSSWKVSHPKKHKSRKFQKPYHIEYRVPDQDKIGVDSILRILNLNLANWNKYFTRYRRYQDAEKALSNVQKWMKGYLDRHDVDIEYRIVKR